MNENKKESYIPMSKFTTLPLLMILASLTACAGITPAELAAIQAGDAIFVEIVNSSCAAVSALDPAAAANAAITCDILDAAGNIVSTTAATIPVAQAKVILAKHPKKVGSSLGLTTPAVIKKP